MKTLEQQQKDAFDAYISAIRYGNEALVRATRRVLDDLTMQKMKKITSFFQNRLKSTGYRRKKTPKVLDIPPVFWYTTCVGWGFNPNIVKTL